MGKWKPNCTQGSGLCSYCGVLLLMGSLHVIYMKRKKHVSNTISVIVEGCLESYHFDDIVSIITHRFCRIFIGYRTRKGIISELNTT